MEVSKFEKVYNIASVMSAVGLAMTLLALAIGVVLLSLDKISDTAEGDEAKPDAESPVGAD